MRSDDPEPRREKRHFRARYYNLMTRLEHKQSWVLSIRIADVVNLIFAPFG
jgi:hypothetical protein